MDFKAIIIDDEINARNLLQGMLEEFTENIEICQLCPNLQEGVKAIYKHKPNLVFLDIEMPGHSGLELLDFFEPDAIDFSIIFTTAYNQYAIQAFKLSAIDYLLKPIVPEELEASIERFKDMQRKQDFTLLKANLSPSIIPKIALHTSAQTNYVELPQIMFIKADGGYSHFYLSNGTTIMVSKTLKIYETLLSEQVYFFRCHKSYIVNTNYVTGLSKSDGGYLVIDHKHNIAISHEKVNELNKLLNSIN
jgi:two-component system LytT family response regulator